MERRIIQNCPDCTA